MDAKTDYIIKRLDESHKEKVVEHFLRLDSDTVYNRFRTPLKQEGLEIYVNKLDFDKHGFFGIFDNELNIVGFGECFLQENGEHAELGFTVESGHQGAGLGSKLMARLVRFAKSQNKHVLEMSCLRNNQKSVHLAKKFGLKIYCDGSESMAEINMDNVKPELEDFNEKIEDTFAFYALKQKEQINCWREGQKILTDTVMQVMNSTMELIKPRIKR